MTVPLYDIVTPVDIHHTQSLALVLASPDNPRIWDLSPGMQQSDIPSRALSNSLITLS